MRKTSQDGGDSTSITSGFENEIKRAGAGLLKCKKSSIKRKVQNFSHESDDGVVEPLLQKDKERTECGKPSAKFLLSRSKTESPNEKEEDQDTLLGDAKSDVPSMSSVPGITDNTVVANKKDNQIAKSHSTMPSHNYMNTNVFISQDAPQSITPKTQILIEIGSNRPKIYSPSPLIFTTAKIHMDGKTKAMEPVQVTPVPILSTIEGNTAKNDPADKNAAAGSYKTHNASKYILDKKTEIKEKVSETEFSDLYSVPSSKETVLTVSEIQLPTTQTTSVIRTTANNSQPLSAANLKKSIKGDEVDSEVKEQSSAKVTLAHSSYSKVTEVNNSFETEHNTKYSPSSSTVMHADNTTCNGKVKTPVVVSGVTREIEIDVNKNIQSVFGASSQKPDTSSNRLLKSNAKGTTNKTDINLSSSFGNKQLQRQKHAIEEAKKKDVVHKPVGPDPSKSTDIPKCIDNSTKFKDNFQTKDIKSIVPDNIKTTSVDMKSQTSAKIVDSPNNVMIVTKTNTVSSIPVPSTSIKSSEKELSLAAENSSKSIVPKSLSTDKKHITTTGTASISKTSNTIMSKPTLNPTVTAVSKTKHDVDTSSNIPKPLNSTPASNVTKSSTSKTGSNEQSVTTATATNVAKTLSTVSTKSVINAERTIDKATTHKHQSSASIAIDQSERFSNKKTVDKPTNTKVSAPTPTQSNTSTVTTMKSSTAGKSSNLIKSTSKTVTTTTAPSTSSNTR